MDSNDLVQHSRARFDHEAARRNLREKYQAKLIFAHNGGMFRAGPDLIILLSLYRDQTVILQDLYENPVRVVANDVLAEAQMRWQEQMTAWHIEHDQIGQHR